MLKTISITLIMLLWLVSASGNIWGNVSTPLPGPPEVYGFYTAGCIAGASALPLRGEGFQVMRPSRNRYYGHPNLIAFVKKLGRYSAEMGERLLIGDLSQPRGGPMPFGHRSHQSGLDADIWFRSVASKQVLPRKDTESLPMISVVTPASGSLNYARWSPHFRDILKITAETAEVERIFVNPVIKQALCRQEQDRTWLHKIRPWWGHDAHFHVRLACPFGHHQCQPQKPPPPGDGCDSDLDKWVKELQEAALYPSSKKKKPPSRAPRVLPNHCTAVLTGM